MNVYYEWDVEIVANGDSPDHEDGEVIEHLFQTTYADCLAELKNEVGPLFRHAVVLVRDDDIGRQWAYIEDGVLPEKFVDADGRYGSKVPQKYHQEVKKAEKGN